MGQAALAACTAPGFSGSKAPELQEDFSIHSPWAGEEESLQGRTLLADSAALKSWRTLHRWGSDAAVPCGTECAQSWHRTPGQRWGQQAGIPSGSGRGRGGCGHRLLTPRPAKAQGPSGGQGFALREGGNLPSCEADLRDGSLLYQGLGQHGCRLSRGRAGSAAVSELRGPAHRSL